MSEMMLPSSKSDVVATANTNKESEHIHYHSHDIIVDDATVDTEKGGSCFFIGTPPSLRQGHTMLQGMG